MKEVLCYGDSNTWGNNPVTQERYDRDERWTRVLQKTLGDEYHVIEEGLNGRTTDRSIVYRIRGDVRRREGKIREVLSVLWKHSRGVRVRVSRYVHCDPVQ